MALCLALLHLYLKSSFGALCDSQKTLIHSIIFVFSGSTLFFRGPLSFCRLFLYTYILKRLPACRREQCEWANCISSNLVNDNVVMAFSYYWIDFQHCHFSLHNCHLLKSFACVYFWTSWQGLICACDNRFNAVNKMSSQKTPRGQIFQVYFGFGAVHIFFTNSGVCHRCLSSETLCTCVMV